MPFLVYGDDDTGNQFAILDKAKKTTVGRLQDNEISFFGNPKVSRYHCEIYFDEASGAYVVKDAGARNGTYVDGTRIAEPVVLQNGAHILVGNQHIFYRDDDSSQRVAKMTVPIRSLSSVEPGAKGPMDPANQTASPSQTGGVPAMKAKLIKPGQGAGAPPMKAKLVTPGQTGGAPAMKAKLITPGQGAGAPPMKAKLVTPGQTGDTAQPVAKAKPEPQPDSQAAAEAAGQATLIIPSQQQVTPPPPAPAKPTIRLKQDGVMPQSVMKAKLVTPGQSAGGAPAQPACPTPDAGTPKPVMKAKLVIPGQTAAPAEPPKLDSKPKLVIRGQAAAPVEPEPITAEEPTELEPAVPELTPEPEIPELSAEPTIEAPELAGADPEPEMDVEEPEPVAEAEISELSVASAGEPEVEPEPAGAYPDAEMDVEEPEPVAEAEISEVSVASAGEPEVEPEPAVAEPEPEMDVEEPEPVAEAEISELSVASAGEPEVELEPELEAATPEADFESPELAAEPVAETEAEPTIVAGVSEPAEEPELTVAPEPEADPESPELTSEPVATEVEAEAADEPEPVIRAKLVVPGQAGDAARPVTKAKLVSPGQGAGAPAMKAKLIKPGLNAVVPEPEEPEPTAKVAAAVQSTVSQIAASTLAGTVPTSTGPIHHFRSQLLEGVECVLNTGVRLDNYQIVRKLGDGHLASVYLAQDISEREKRMVALKLFHRNLEANPAAIEEFLTTITDAAQMQYDHFVLYFQAGTYKNRCYYTMDYVQNGDLGKYRSHQNHYAEFDGLAMVTGIAKAMDVGYRHCGLVHRNLNPSNVLLDPDYKPVISDYGTGFWGACHLMEGYSVASPYFMAPEQIVGGDIDWYTDQYSLGMIMYYLFAGRPAFKSDDEEEVMHMQVSKKVPHFSIADTNVQISNDTWEIITRMTAKQPEKRFSEWAEVVTALEDTLERLKRQSGSIMPYVPEKPHTVMSVVRRGRITNKKLIIKKR